MNRKPKITESEWPIMEVLWNRGTVTAAVIVDEITGKRDVSMRTVKTLIRRLVAKGMITFSVDPADARIYHYTAAVSREAGVQDKNRSILDLVYGGRAGDLLANFVEKAPLNAGEIERLQRLLDQKKADAGQE